MNNLFNAIYEVATDNNHQSYFCLSRTDQDVLVSAAIRDEKNMNIYDFIEEDRFNDVPLLLAKLLDSDSQDTRDELIDSLKNIARKYYENQVCEAYDSSIGYNRADYMIGINAEDEFDLSQNLDNAA